VVTTTSTVAEALADGEVATTWVGLWNCTEAAGFGPKATVEARVNPVPVMVTAVPPAKGPTDGERPVTVGALA
jgi:hypothetical protein